MAKSTIKLRTKEKGGKIQVKALITHPMETGLRKDKKTGDKIPAHYITEVKVEANGKTVMTADWSGSVSKNPFLSFTFTGGAAGEMIELSWVGNNGESESASATIK